MVSISPRPVFAQLQGFPSCQHHRLTVARQFEASCKEKQFPDAKHYQLSHVRLLGLNMLVGSTPDTCTSTGELLEIKLESQVTPRDILQCFLQTTTMQVFPSQCSRSGHEVSCALQGAVVGSAREQNCGQICRQSVVVLLLMQLWAMLHNWHLQCVISRICSHSVRIQNNAWLEHQALGAPSFAPVAREGQPSAVPGGEKYREIFAVKKRSEISPPAKLLRCVTNDFTANSDAGELCEFRHVQRRTRQRESRAHQEISGTIQSPPGHNSNLQDSWRWQKFPLPNLSPLKLSPGKFIPPPCSSILHLYSVGNIPQHPPTYTDTTILPKQLLLADHHDPHHDHHDHDD